MVGVAATLTGSVCQHASAIDMLQVISHIWLHNLTMVQPAVHDLIRAVKAGSN
jgi:hypothetical protein